MSSPKSTSNFLAIYYTYINILYNMWKCTTHMSTHTVPNSIFKPRMLIHGERISARKSSCNYPRCLFAKSALAVIRIRCAQRNHKNVDDNKHTTWAVRINNKHHLHRCQLLIIIKINSWQSFCGSFGVVYYLAVSGVFCNKFKFMFPLLAFVSSHCGSLFKDTTFLPLARYTEKMLCIEMKLLFCVICAACG